MTYSKLQVQNIVQLAGNDETKCAAANHDNQKFCKQLAESQLTRWPAETLPIPNKVTNIENEMRYGFIDVPWSPHDTSTSLSCLWPANEFF